ncbi:hypothetical protein [Lysobacter sp. Root983]|uniref:hypothetical protein n=1 Tax=Lysobacter sp. Root983 TaxID=1736613 RepID=UPI00070A445E|nr:hypothetical protein [Lysobacter sp. Root983]KRD75685.1 hypothetical protein ASE43_12610 [Lysobacter sp. Root983]
MESTARFAARSLHQARAWALLLVLSLCALPASATGTLFRFSAGTTPADFFSFELVGREDPGFPQTSWTGSGQYEAHPKAYVVRMDRAGKRLTVRHTNPGDSRQPPSFVLEVQGDAGTLTLGRKTLTGRADWDVL